MFFSYKMYVFQNIFQKIYLKKLNVLHGWNWTRPKWSVEFHLGPQALGCAPLLIPGALPGAGLDMEYLGLELNLMWDVNITGCGLMHCTTTQAPFICKVLLALNKTKRPKNLEEPYLFLYLYPYIPARVPLYLKYIIWKVDFMRAVLHWDGRGLGWNMPPQNLVCSYSQIVCWMRSGWAFESGSSHISWGKCQSPWAGIAKFLVFLLSCSPCSSRLG